MKKLLIAFIVFAILIGGFFVLNSYIYREKQGDDTAIEPYRASLEGTYVCLSYRDTAEVPSEAGCEPGIRTDVGEYYAVNFFLMSQIQAPLEVGQRFSANGVITTNDYVDPVKWQTYQLVGIFSVTDSVMILGDSESYACTADAKLCPDGTYVGRQGPDCEFAMCQPFEADSSRVTMSVGESVSALNLTVSPQEVLSDSRCPVDVECVWAGTVEVRTTLATQVAHGEHILTLGEPQVFGDYAVTLVEVSPAKTQEVIPNSMYQLIYLVSLK